MAFVLPFVAAAATAFSVVGFNPSAPPAAAAPQPWAELVVPATNGGPIEAQLVMHHTAGLGGFEAALRYDRAAADLGGMRVPTQSLANGARLVPLATVDTTSGIDIGAWSCGQIAGCPKASAGTVGDTAAIATIELAPYRDGRFDIALDNLVVVDTDGRRVSLSRIPTPVTVDVGHDGTRFAAPAAAHLAPGSSVSVPNNERVDLNGDRQVSLMDVAMASSAWTMARDTGVPCGPSIDATSDVNGDGCIDVADLQTISGKAATYHAVRLIAAPTTTYVVNSTSDSSDAGADGVCATSAGVCSLRAAIAEGNARSGPVVINFNIAGTGVHTLAPASAYPTLVNAYGFTIDGYSQPGSSPNTDPTIFNGQIRIEIDGRTNFVGLNLGGPNNLVRGLSMHGFQYEILMNGTGSTNNVVAGNIFGLLPSGASDSSPGNICVVMQGGASFNFVGQPGAATRNVISACGRWGVSTFNYLTDSNTIQNNIIGMGLDGVTRRSNPFHGVDINTFSTNILVGGSLPGQGNVLSGNGGEGAEISHGTGTIHNKIIGNLIGADAYGNATTASRNNEWGVHLEGFANCGSGVCPLDAGFETVSGNVIVGSQKGGIIADKGMHDTTIDHNKIGVLPDGTAAGNVNFGIRIEAGSIRNTIGPGNEIAFNTNAIQIQAIGVEPPDPTASPTHFNRVTQNSIHDNDTGWLLGIDLAPWGTPNVGGVGDPNVNEQVDAPVLSAVTAASVDATTCAGCTVELFQADRGAGAYGSGSLYLYSATADGSGNARLYFPPSMQGNVLTATSTTPNGSTSEFSHNIAVPFPRAGATAPVASFTINCTHLTCDTDGSGSTKTGGTIVRYEWNWGDGTTTEGVTSSHRYSSVGNNTVTLTVTDNDAMTGTASQGAAVTDAAPVASFTASCTYQLCSFNAAASSDSDGSVVSYTWDFGDGATTTVSTPAAGHTYASSGTYVATLVVIDNDGAPSAPVQQSSSVVALPPGSVGVDAFGRTQASGWGSADIGGAYATNVPGSLSVNGAMGSLVVPAGNSRLAYLPGMSERDVDLTASVAPTQQPVGGTYGTTIAIEARRTQLNNAYRARFRVATNGNTFIALTRVVNGSNAETLLAPEVKLGFVYSPGTRFNVRFDVLGVNPATVQARVWIEGLPEPSTWNVVATDSSPSLQTNGSAGVHAYLDAGVTSAPVTWTVDNLLFRFINTPPTANFTSTCVNRNCSFNATTSTDSDGTIASYAWDFGDGVVTSGPGATVSHTYAAFGGYSVKLTVTDNKGATATVTNAVDPANVLPVAAFTLNCPDVNCTANAAASADPDGSIVSYAWDWSDGTTTTGVTTAHTFTAPDIYTLTLTVTDSDGGIGIASQNITALPPDVPPVAAFTPSCVLLVCNVDATASTDSDGIIIDYAWDFGDGTTSNGSSPTATHTYTLTSTPTITLTVTDDRGASTTASTQVSIIGPNVAPVPSFTTSCNQMTCGVNGSASTDSDGSIVNYAWDFGDGTAGSGVTANHTYAVPGFYTVTLSVTDDQSATASTTRTVDPLPAPAPGPYATDTFTRTVSNGWGTADTGGAWTIGSGSSNYQVTGTSATMSLTSSNASTSARLLTQSLGDVDLRARISSNRSVTGSGQMGSLVARRVSAGNEYRARIRFVSNNTVTLAITRVVNNTETLIGSETTISGLTYSRNTFFDIHAQVVGANPTTIRARAWLDTQAEPSTWQITRTDSTAALQANGAVGLVSLLSNASSTPVVITWDDYVARPVNLPPTASFTLSCTALDCNVNGSASTDPQGAITSYAWNWADGTITTGVTSSHQYATGGPRVVTLTVTDAAGLQAVATQTAHPNQPPTASFTSSCTPLGCTFDGTASSDADGSIVTYAWDFGDGTTGLGSTTTHGYAGAGTWTVTLTVTDDGNVSSASSQSVVTVTPNIPPVAAFTPTCTNLDCTVDATAASDPDGSIVSYAWDFGDSTADSGVTAAHTYATGGTYTITLTVTDDRAGVTSTSIPVTVLPANVLPVAAFTSSCTSLGCTFDATSSTDPDGSIVTYAWDFGDGTTGTGVTAAHSYPAPGVYTPALTVTDDRAGTNSFSQAVTTTAPPPPPPYATDTFTRSVTNGWGNATTGGAWTLANATSAYQVTGTAGTMTVATAGTGVSARLLTQALGDVDLRVRVSADKVGAGNGQWGALVARRVANGTEYRVRIRFFPNNGVGMSISRVVTNTETLIGTESVIPGLVYAPNSFYDIHAQVVGTNPTTIRARVWLDTQPEPGVWQMTQTDATAALQTAGGVGLWSYISGTSSNAPVTFTYDDFVVENPNIAPTPHIVASCTPSTLVCDADGSTSTDPEGPVSAYTWSWGDGTVSTGPTANHTYLVGGTYTLTLTVTDSSGYQTSTTQTVSPT